MKRKGEKKKGRKEEKRKKQRLFLPEKKELFDERGLFSSNVLNNPATSLHLSKFVKTW